MTKEERKEYNKKYYQENKKQILANYQLKYNTSEVYREYIRKKQLEYYYKRKAKKDSENGAFIQGY